LPAEWIAIHKLKDINHLSYFTSGGFVQGPLHDCAQLLCEASEALGGRSLRAALLMINKTICAPTTQRR
jgi:hypothetical protein